MSRRIVSDEQDHPGLAKARRASVRARREQRRARERERAEQVRLFMEESREWATKRARDLGLDDQVGGWA